MIAIRRSAERGHLNHGWLDTYHSFSFGDYYDPQQMGFRSLRVINEDVVAPGRGFGMHPHRDMEILTWVLSGSLEHRDSLGSAGTIAPGQLQYMCAGRGILHSEFNPSPSVPVHLMQIWIVPRERGLTPRYDQRTFAPDAAGATVLASPDGAEGSMPINQDARVLAVRLLADRPLVHELAAGRAAWVQVLRGDATVNGQALTAGDAAGVTDERRLALVATEGAELLVFDLA